MDICSRIVGAVEWCMDKFALPVIFVVLLAVGFKTYNEKIDKAEEAEYQKRCSYAWAHGYVEPDM